VYVRVLSSPLLFQEAVTDVPVVLVGNKTDQWGDRMVTLEEGQRRSKEIGCVCFHEISVRESIEQVHIDTSSETVLNTELPLTKAVVIQYQCSVLLTF
jgi:GTPase SAR1 family protein